MRSLLAFILAVRASGSAQVAFDTARRLVVRQTGGLMVTCKGLCALFCIILLVGVVRDILQETAGGHGEVPLGRIFRPFFVMLLLVSFPMLVGLCNTVFGGAGRASASAFAEAWNGFDVNLRRSWDNGKYAGAKEVRSGRYFREYADGSVERGVVETAYWDDEEPEDIGDPVLQPLMNWLHKKKLKAKRFFARMEYFVFDVLDGLTDGIGGLIFAICQYVVSCYANIMLTIMAAMGPIAITFSALPPWKDASKQFFGKYITYCLWLPIIGLVVAAATKAAHSCGNIAQSGNFVMDSVRAALKIFIYLGACHMVFKTGSVANDAVSLAETSGMDGATGAGGAAVGAAVAGAASLAKGLVKATGALTAGTAATAAYAGMRAAGTSKLKAGALSQLHFGEAKAIDKEMKKMEKAAEGKVAKEMKGLKDEVEKLKGENKTLRGEKDNLRAQNDLLKSRMNARTQKVMESQFPGSVSAKGNSQNGGGRQKA